VDPVVIWRFSDWGYLCSIAQNKPRTTKRKNSTQ